MVSSTSVLPKDIRKSDHFILWLSRHWILAVSILLGIYALSPFFAPVFMDVGLTLPARIIYWIYSFLCHQLPERSYFLFGPKFSYSLSEIQSIWINTTNAAILRQFVGTQQIGWKVAWSDRMVSMFTSLWLFGILWGFVKKKIPTLPIWGFILLLIPMFVDGTTHMISDLAGIGQGFRDSNTWLLVLTNNTLPVTFYAGDAWGSFNAWMRLITGVFFGLGIVWLCYPYINDSILNSAETVKYKYQRILLLNEGKLQLARLSSRGVSHTVEVSEDPHLWREGRNDKEQ